MTSPILGDLTSTDIESGVNERGAPFCKVRATGTHDDREVTLLGQLDPAEVRTLALHWLETAEAADQDAAVLRVCRKLELPDEFAGAVIIELREMRDQ